MKTYYLVMALLLAGIAALPPYEWLNLCILGGGRVIGAQLVGTVSRGTLGGIGGILTKNNIGWVGAIYRCHGCVFYSYRAARVLRARVLDRV